MALRKSLLDCIPVMLIVIFYGYITQLHRSDKFIVWAYIGICLAMIIRVIFIVRNSNKKVENLRLEINDVKIAFYTGDILESSIQFENVTFVKQSERGIKVKKKNDPMFDVLISKNYEKIDEILALISSKINVVVA